MRALRGSIVVSLLAAGLVAAPALPATAGPEHCPAGVTEVRGSNPAWPQVSAWLEASAAAHDVPAAILKAIALRESDWAHFHDDGRAKISSDGVCGVGMMQVTADGRADAVKLAEDVAYNIDEGARILAEKWDVSQQTPPPSGAQPDDPAIMENWYYAICLYNGCGSNPTYPTAVAQMVADPFRRVPWRLWQWMRPAGFTLPQDANPSYVFPSAFQARDGEFVFYDHTTGTVTKTVPAITHRVASPPVIAYPKRVHGPDKPLGPGVVGEVTCGVCGGWRLAEGHGVQGRAHWTNTVTTAPQTSASWYHHEPGRFRVAAYVPALPNTTLGRATYRIRPTSDDTKHYTLPVVDQQARKGSWVGLGDWTLDGSAKVYLNDGSSVGGQPIVADAVRFTPVPEMRIALSYGRTWPSSVDYGASHVVAVSLSLPPQLGLPVSGRTVKIYRRVAGTTAWQMLGAWPTNAEGGVDISTRPHANMEYTARFTSPDGEATIANAESRNVRMDVRQVVKASMSRTSMRSGETFTVSTSVTPNHATQLVYLQRFYGGMWRNVTYRSLSGTGTASFTVRFSQPCCSTGTKHLWRVHKAGDRDHAAGVSPTMTLYVTN